MRRSALSLAVAAAIVAAGCSSGVTPDETRPLEVGAAPSPVASEGARAKTAGRSTKDAKRKKKVENGAPGSSEEGAKSDSSGAPARSGGGGGASGAVRRPAEGNYALTQDGWEEFCQGGVCEREKLPPSVAVEIGWTGSDGFQTRSKSGSTDQTISYRLRGDELQISKIVTSSSYRGFSYQTVVDPQPPIVSLRFPLEPGRSWSGRWENRGEGPDGSYSGEVLKRVSAPQRGGEDAFLIELKLFFTGEVKGYTTIKATVAARDLMVLQVRSKTEAQSSFGTYRSEYESEYRG